MLHHMNRAAAKTPSVSYRNSYNSATNLTTYTFNASDIGTANTSRLVVVQVHGQASTGTRSVNTLTIGGTGATGYQNTARLYHNSLWALAVSTGTTASIVVTFSGTMLNCLIAVYALYDLNSNIPVNSQATTATNATTISLTTSAREKGIVIGGITGAANATTTWTGVTERYDTTVESTVRSGGESVIATTNTSYSVQANTTVSGNLTLVAGSWR
jgi:hypothetical protein